MNKDLVIDFDEKIEEVEKNLPREEIEKLHKGVRNSNKYSLEETKTRNVLIVGRTRSGKSTAIGVLKDPCYEPKEMSIFSDTVDPKFQSFALDDKNRNIKYTVNIIDTPGLKEVTAMGLEARTDEVILNTINYCLKNEITKVNILLIFISFEIGVSSDDLDSFQSFLEKFGHDNIQIGICVTRSEDKSDRWKDGIKEQLSKHKYFSTILQRKNVRVCFMGCVDACENSTISNIEDLKRLYIKVYRMREELLKIIFDSESQVMLVDLPIAMQIVMDVHKVFALQNEILDYLTGVTDYDVAAVQSKITEFAENVEKMASKPQGIWQDGELQSKFQKMKERVKAVSAKMNDAQKKRFVGKLII